MLRRTKIVATLGPATDDPKVLDEVIAAGVDVVRLNMSHGTHEDHAQRADWVRNRARASGRQVGVLAAAGIEAIFYDQLGSYYSDQPEDTDLWRTPRFVDEVEQVRQALDQARRARLAQGLAEGGAVAQVAGRDDNPVGNLPVELLHDLDADRPLPLHAQAVHRVGQVNGRVFR